MRPDFRLASLDVDVARLERCWGWLNAGERERASRFHFDRDRKHWVAARGWLREELARTLDSDPARLAFHYAERGKPSVDGIEFNLSHSGGMAMLALSSSGPVGADLEEVKADFEWDGVARLAFSPRENEALREEAEAARARRFYSIWTMKEAYVKATGCGLSDPTSAFTVWPEFLLGAEWRVEKVEAGERFEAAIAWRCAD